MQFSKYYWLNAISSVHILIHQYSNYNSNTNSEILKLKKLKNFFNSNIIQIESYPRSVNAISLVHILVHRLDLKLILFKYK